MARSDVVASAFGAATAFAGLTLVFLGVVVRRYDEALPGASRRVRARFIGPTAGIFTAFMIGLANTAISFLWLVAEGGYRWYATIVVLFLVQLVATALSAGYVALGILTKT